MGGGKGANSSSRLTHSLTHSLPRQGKERKEGKSRGRRESKDGHGARSGDNRCLAHTATLHRHVWISLILAQATCSAATETPSLIRLCQRLHSSRAVSFVPGEAEARDESTNQTSACNSVHGVIIRAPPSNFQHEAWFEYRTVISVIAAFPAFGASFRDSS